MRAHFMARAIALLSVLFVGSGTASAITAAAVKKDHPDLVATERAANPTLSEDEAANKVAEEKNQESEQKFAGFGFSPALLTTFDVGRPRVDSADLVGDPKKVRVTKDSSTRVGFGLEAHYFFLPPYSLLGQIATKKWGVGPFVSLTLGTNDIIDNVGAGILLGMQRDAIIERATGGRVVQEGAGDSFNLGIGLSIDPDAQVLGKGFHENQAPPAGEDSVRYRTTTQVGVQLVFSYYFNPF